MGFWPPAGVQRALPERRGQGLGARWAFAARGRRPGQNPSTGAFEFRFSWSRGHARQNVWPYMRRDVTHSGGLKSLQRTEARGASANSMRSVRASISWQSGFWLQWLVTQPRCHCHRPHNNSCGLQHSLTSGGGASPRVMRSVAYRTGKIDQSSTEIWRFNGTNNR